MKWWLHKIVAFGFEFSGKSGHRCSTPFERHRLDSQVKARMLKSLLICLCETCIRLKKLSLDFMNAGTNFQVND